jgi:integrase
MYGALTKLLLLTGQRLRKVAHLHWDDIDSNGVWTIRTERREKAHAGKVKLPTLALELIRPPRVEGNPHVFPAARGSGPLNAFAELKRAIDEKLPANMPPWVLHDLRRTARSLLARERLRVPDHIAERLLGHQLQGVQRVYNRHPYFEEKSEALAKVADEVVRIVNPPVQLAPHPA